VQKLVGSLHALVEADAKTAILSADDVMVATLDISEKLGYRLVMFINLYRVTFAR